MRSREEGDLPVARLGDLERAVMEILWDLPATTQAGGRPTLTAREVAAALDRSRSLAYTTVLTVLDRLERKGLVRRLRDGRAHHYAPMASRAAYVAELMLDALGSASDRGAVLMHFADQVSGEEAEVLRRALGLNGTADRAGVEAEVRVEVRKEGR